VWPNYGGNPLVNKNDITILLVEDNPNDVELTLDALREHNLANRIQVVRDGAEALDFVFCQGPYVQRNNRNPKPILLDLKLPKVSGLEVLQSIRADPHTRTTPVVVFTASKEDRDITASYDLWRNQFKTVLCRGGPACPPREHTLVLPYTIVRHLAGFSIRCK
jgi:two-component system response regulator